MKRRKFIAGSSMAVIGVPFLNNLSETLPDNASDDAAVKDYLGKILYTREEVDGWFAGKLFPFSKFHSQFGWLLNDDSFRDGLNNSWSVYTYKKPDGERIMANYSDKPCRINTYGDSFTQCHQVSDNETWQEVLAAHLQEPVRNFGIGGWSFYQAYLRMLREEERTPGSVIIMNIFADDHLRNLDSWRNIRAKKHPQHIEATLPYLKVDMKKGIIKECENPCPTPDSYYKLCNINDAYKIFRDDFVLKIMIAHQKSGSDNPQKQYASLMDLTKTHGIETKIDTGSTLSETADKIHREAALFSSKLLVEKIEDYAEKNNKKVLWILSYPPSYIGKHYREGIRWDKEFIDFMVSKNVPLIDLSQLHLDDFENYKIDFEKYLSAHFVGHYNPRGNFFCAHAVRDKLIKMLDPKPLSYAR